MYEYSIDILYIRTYSHMVGNTEHVLPRYQYTIQLMAVECSVAWIHVALSVRRHWVTLVLQKYRLGARSDRFKFIKIRYIEVLNGK